MTAITPPMPEQPTLPHIDVCFAPPELGEELVRYLYRPDTDDNPLRTAEGTDIVDE